METKAIFAVILVLAALAAGYYFLVYLPQQQPHEPLLPAGYPDPLNGKQNATMEKFAANLAGADTVYLVEDIRGLDSKYPLSRNNIMQCGVDFSASEGLMGKSLYIYVFEGDTCTGSEAGSNVTISSVKGCYSKVFSSVGKPGSVLIWIGQGATPKFYSEGISVEINDTYSQGMCGARFALPEEAAGNSTAGGSYGSAPTTEAAVPDLNASEADVQQPSEGAGPQPSGGAAPSAGNES